MNVNEYQMSTVSVFLSFFSQIFFPLQMFRVIHHYLSLWMFWVGGDKPWSSAYSFFGYTL